VIFCLFPYGRNVVQMVKNLCEARIRTSPEGVLESDFKSSL